MGDEMLIACEQCSAQKEMSALKLDKRRNVLLCSKCYYKAYSSNNKVEDHIIQAVDVKRIKYFCSSCGFKFARSEGFHFGGVCVHCGRKTVRREDTNELLIRDAKTLLDY